MTEATAVGLIGCGVIAEAYAKNLRELTDTDLVACADLDGDRAIALAKEHGIPNVLAIGELLSDPNIECVLNLTPPIAHREVITASLEAGKATFSEKPLGVDLADGEAVVALAGQEGLRLGCAPDTFLGSAAQTARRAIDEGMIGEPVAATANFLGAGPEAWHPGPEIFYKVGGGPMLDMGPYYLTSLVNLLGPAQRLSAVTAKGREQREIGSGPQKGQVFDVDIPTHVVGLIEFGNGVNASVTTSFDVQASGIRNGIEIYGTEATLAVPDPNIFGGDVRLKKYGDPEWTTLPNLHGNADGGRGLGLAEMLWADRNDRPHRASGDLALHILDLMTSAVVAGAERRSVELTTTCVQPAALPAGLGDAQFE